MIEHDFAISYAGEDEKIAKEIVNKIKNIYGDYTVFFAPNEQHQLVGQDGEELFEEIFSKSKQVIVLISEHYKKKTWTRYEWDVIKGRDKENRFIPIRLDNARISGLPSSIMYLLYDDNSVEIADVCVKKLIAFEEKFNIERMTEYQKIYQQMNNSKGSTVKAFQLVKSNRKRTPLADIDFPKGDIEISYKVLDRKWVNFSVIRRLLIDIELPEGLSKKEVAFNIEHCVVTEFNREKPDAIGITAFCKDKNYIKENPVMNLARADFAPFGEWGEAQDGFAYDLPVESFETKIDFQEEYWDHSLPKKTADSMAIDATLEMLKNKLK